VNIKRENKKLSIAIAQINLTVGDINGNIEKIKQVITTCKKKHADIILFPELSLTGYPPEDLLWRPGLRTAVENGLQELKLFSHGIASVIGHPEWSGKNVFNAASVFSDGEISATYRKQELPNYSVFDEKRYFNPGSESCVFSINDIKLGISLCEDAWVPKPIKQACQAGAELILNLNASPFHYGKMEARESKIAERALENQIPIIYSNLVGGQDELVFDGASFITNEKGKTIYREPAFIETQNIIELEINNNKLRLNNPSLAPHPPLAEAVYQTLVLGVRDYVRKSGFNSVVLGLSGGIDSALTMAIAVDALGAKNVQSVMMPSRYTTKMSVDDAATLAANLKVEHSLVSIEPSFNAFLSSLSDEFSGYASNVAEENIQARCRGIILMAISNKKGKMVLTTGNKSEMAVGYSTLYGDMAGGFDVLKDVPKSMVFLLSRYCNRNQEIIPTRIIERPPSAELRDNQVDQDSLPPYHILDEILERYVEKDQSTSDIIGRGFDKEVVLRVVSLLDRNEYKRRQSPPGVRITARAFGKDRRYPMVSGYTEREFPVE